MASTSSIRVALADDHRMIHELVTKLVRAVDDIQIVGHASNGREAIEVCEQVMPDLLLLDVLMPVMDGIEACEHILEQFPSVKVLVLSSFDDEASVRSMLDKGAAGYIVKAALSTDLLDTIRAIHRGNTVLSPGIMKLLLNPGAVETNFDLTDRELAVLRHMASGESINEVAEALIISRSTVKYHLSNILLKMHVETRAEAIALAAKAHLI
jgi:NarL family two-component system response regulator LiaR